MNVQPMTGQAPVQPPQAQRLVLKSPAELAMPTPPQAPVADNTRIAQQVPSGSAQQQVALYNDSKPVSESELNWAGELEQHVQQGHQPDEREVTRYQDIVQRLQAQRLDNAQQAGVSENDFVWAQQLEVQLAQNYQPNDQEIQRYNQIVTQLRGAPPVEAASPASPPQAAAQAPTGSAPGISQEEYNWAVTLEQKVQQGYSPTQVEVDKYQQINQRVVSARQQEASPAVPAPVKAPVPQAEQAKPESNTHPAVQLAPQPTLPQQPEITAAAEATQPIPVSAQPAPVAPVTPVANEAVDLGNLVKEKVDLSEKFASLSAILDQSYLSRKLEGLMSGQQADVAAQVNPIGVQIWLDGDLQDKLRLSTMLVKGGQSELLGRIMSHEETQPLQVAELMSQASFPVQDYMNALSDNQAFVVLNSLASVAQTGEPSSAQIIQKTIDGYDRFWDREAPFEQLKNSLSAQGQWEQLPAALRTSIDKLID